MTLPAVPESIIEAGFIMPTRLSHQVEETYRRVPWSNVFIVTDGDGDTKRVSR